MVARPGWDSAEAERKTVHVVERAAAAAEIEAVGDRTGDKFFRFRHAVPDRESFRQPAGYGRGKRTAGSVGIAVFYVRTAEPDGFTSGE